MSESVRVMLPEEKAHRKRQDHAHRLHDGEPVKHILAVPFG